MLWGVYGDLGSRRQGEQHEEAGEEGSELPGGVPSRGESDLVEEVEETSSKSSPVTNSLLLSSGKQGGALSEPLIARVCMTSRAGLSLTLACCPSSPVRSITSCWVVGRLTWAWE